MWDTRAYSFVYDVNAQACHVSMQSSACQLLHPRSAAVGPQVEEDGTLSRRRTHVERYRKSSWRKHEDIQSNFRLIYILQPQKQPFLSASEKKGSMMGAYLTPNVCFVMENEQAMPLGPSSLLPAFRSEDAITRISEARQDVRIIIQAPVDRTGEDPHVWV